MAIASTADSRAAPKQAAAVASAADPQLVADMKQEIRILVEEIAELATQDIPPAEFYAGYIDRLVAALAAVGGAVWTPDENGKLKLQAQVNFRATGADASSASRTRHGLLLDHIFGGKQAALVQPGADHAGLPGTGNPTELLIVLAPLIVEHETLAVVEIFQRPGGAISTQRGYLRFLVQMCDVACDYLKSRRLRELAEHQSLWRQLEEFVAAAHRSLEIRQTAYAIVNEGRRLIGCDRVSLALAYGSRCRIEAVSGLDAIDRRATQVQHLATLAEAVLRTGEPLWGQEGQAELAPQIQAPLQRYVDQSHSRLVAVLPLMAAVADSSLPARKVGALIVEQIRDARLKETSKRRAEVVAQHGGAALSNAIEHGHVFLLPLWKALGRATWLVRGRMLPKTLLSLAIFAAVALALVAVPTNFEVAARGKLQPAERREIFAPLDGVVANVPVQHGDVVEAGAVLAELTNTDLDLQITALIGRQTTNQERRAALERTALDTRNGAGRLAPAEENRLAGELMQLRQESENIDGELALLRQKQQQLVITAPQRGQVVTWNVRELLLQRPVARGQGLLTLADPQGPWELELNLPERRLAHVQAARQPLEVTFVLSSHPAQVFSGRVTEIEQTAEVRGDEGNTVLVRVAVEKSQLPPLHDQTTVTAKLHCGRTSVGYAWFCDLIETVLGKILFWLPS